MSKIRLLLLLVIGLLLIAIVGVWGILSSIHNYDNRIFTPEEVSTEKWSHPRVAIVFGAAVYQDDLSTMLEDRVKTSIDLYRAHKIDRILVSGDNRRPEYNEPKAMADYLASHAVDPKHIVIDYAGRSTYETCLRAKEIFGLDRAILITQRTHLSRALYLANHLGLDGIGVVADKRNYGSENSYQKLREVGASVKAFLNVYISPPHTVLGEKLPIQ